MKQLLSLLVLLIALNVNSQIEEHPIDIRNSTCHDVGSNQTTFGMVQCENAAKDEWEKEMNKYYNLLLDTVSKRTANLIKEAQQAWIKYNTKEQELSISIYYGDLDGTMWEISNAQRQKNLFRKRAIELRNYYELFVFEEE